MAKARVKWNNKFYIKSYQFALAGMTDVEIAEALGVSLGAFKGWINKRSTLQFALDEGRSRMKVRGNSSLRDYIYNQLPRKLKKLWNRIDKCADHPNAVQRMDALFDNHGEGARKHLFLYALTTSHFNPSQACRKVGVSKATVDRWIEQDIDFAQMVDQIHYHKKNFCDQKLMELVDDKDPAVVMFVSRTLNRDRGYSDKQEVEITGTINHTHKHSITVDDRVLSIMSPKAVKELYKAVEAVSHKTISSEPVDALALNQEQKLITG